MQPGALAVPAAPGRPVLTATISSIMARALYPDGLPQHPDAPPCPSCSPADYAVAFRMATRDTVFTWNVTSSGTPSGLTTAFRDGNDSQPTLAPDGRTVADGSPTSNAVYLWTPP
jgi:hypothetical protein